MKTKTAVHFALILWLLFVLGASSALFLMFQAGCTGDLKGGSFGDPIRALELENIGFLSMLVSASSGGAALTLTSQSKNRIAGGAGFALFALACLWLISMALNTLTPQLCH